MATSLASVPGTRRLSRTSATSPFRHVDLVLLLATFLLIYLGNRMVFSASFARLQANGTDPHYLEKRQLIFAAIGVVALFAVTLIDYRRYQGWLPLLYPAVLVMFALVLTPLGGTVNGAKGWFVIGTFQVQPAEYAKPVIVLTLAAAVAGAKGQLNLGRFTRAVVLAALPMGLLALQPDLGTCMIYTGVLVGILLVAGARPRHLIILGLLGVIGIVGAFQVGVVKDYQKARLTAFLDPKHDAQRTGYNLQQSQIAVGSGGIWGKGFRKGTQTNLSYVPEQYTDFIFSAMAEQEGFFKLLGFMVVYGVLIWRGLRIATSSRDFYGTLVAAGVTTLLAFQAFLNIGVSIGIMPVTGVTLPLISYGGSSLITTCVLIGLLQNIHMRRMTTAPLP